MATRNRTQDFLKLRHPRRSAPSLPHTGDTDRLLSETAAIDVIPEWVKTMREVRQREKKIEVEMKELETLQQKHLKVQFGVARDEEHEEVEIETKSSRITSLFKSVESLINQLDQTFREGLDSSGGTDAELSILRNVKMCLINEVSQLSSAFRDNQRLYLSDIQKQTGVRKRWGPKTEKEVAARARRDALLEQGITQDQIETIMQTEHLSIDLERDFQSILDSVKSLHEMFKDLNTLIIEQGTVLDRIDYNMQVTHERVSKARSELEKSAKHQAAGSFKICVLLLIVCIFGFSIALVFKVAG